MRKKLKIVKEIDISKFAIGLTQKDFVFSINPTKEELKQVEIEGRILVAYSKDIEECIKFRERLGESSYLIIWLDQSPIKIDGKELDFKEFFLGYYLERMKKGWEKNDNVNKR